MASVSSLATSFGRTESISSEHLFRDETGEKDLGCEYLKGMFKELAVSLKFTQCPKHLYLLVCSNMPNANSTSQIRK